MNSTRNKARWATWFWVTALVLAPGAVLADITIPNSFTAGTVIKSADVNADMAALNTGKQDKMGSVVLTVSAAGPRFAIDHPLANSNPNAVVVATHVSSAPGDVFAHTTGVTYDTTSSKWLVYSEDGTNIQPNTKFDVLVMAAAQ